MARKKSCGGRGGKQSRCAAGEVDLHHMLFGHNTDVKVGETVYHVQTEDRGAPNALIDTTVYCRGRVLHRRTNNYLDLLPLDPDRENSVRKRIDEQHRGVTDEIRSGALHLVPPLPSQEKPPSKKSQPVTSVNGAPTPGLALELINAKNWLTGKRANLHVSVRKKENGEPVRGARVTSHIDGAADATEFTAQTGADGQARLEFDMPRLAGGEPALVIEAAQADARTQLRFQLKARPRVPTA